MRQFELDSLTEYSDGAILEEMRRVVTLHSEGPLTTTAFGQLSPKVSWSTIQKRFGGWKNALKAAGLSNLCVENHMPYSAKVRCGKAMSGDELIVEMRRIHLLVGRDVLTTKDFNRRSVTHSDAVRERYGNWKAALGKAGISQSEAGKRYSDEECFENLASVWTHYGRPPQHDEMRGPPSMVGPKAYVLRWGTWRKSLKAFVEWAETEDQTRPSQVATNSDGRELAGTQSLVQPIRIEQDCREVRPGLRFKIFMRDRFRCVACGRSPATHLNVELHADHIVSVYDGGRTVDENLQTLCQDCNLGKGRTSIR
jgi:hypothetical protein